ncbi:hypothetical protein HPB52_019372 [Rhipicephalus sanguineus]|uniref:Uncharacterized protein n=1 Tax=Rhipicephalus sanguineus TaxID=34632 RepID=A0A9D4QBU0_RHISA|nr:hypothetical protein HPB52_019372 [Rhipicephalus sanguineus]
MAWTLVTAKASLTAASVTKTLERKPSSVQAETTARFMPGVEEQMKCRSVTGVLSNKSISLGVKKPKPALTPEKLNSLKALFRIYMGDRTPADIADKRMKDVRKHLCQKLGDVQRKGAS